MSLKDYNYSATQLLDACNIRDRTIKISNISIGASLEHLNSLGNTGKEFDGGCDGIDALCYQLDKFTCEKAIKTLQKVLKRFEDIK